MGRTHDVTISGFDLDHLEAELASARLERDEWRDEHDRVVREYQHRLCVLAASLINATDYPEPGSTTNPETVAMQSIPETDDQIIDKAQRDRLNQGLLALASWCSSRAMASHDTDTTLTMLERKVNDLRHKMMKAGWAAINARYAESKPAAETNE